MKELLSYGIPLGSKYELKLSLILGAIALYFIVRFLLKITKAFFNRLEKNGQLSAANKSTFYSLIKYILFGVSLSSLISLSGYYTQIKSIVRTNFIDFKSFKLSLLHIIIIILIIILSKLLIGVLNSIFDKMVSRNTLDDRNKKSIFLLSSYFIWTVTAVIILQISGVELTLLLGGSAALLVGLGLGLQQIFSDVVSGIFLLIEGSIKVGDIMQTDDVVGKVINIRLRTSEIMTREGIAIIVPNHKFITESVINWSHNASITRFNVDVGVAYGSDPQLVKRLLLECAEQHPKIVSNKSYKSFVRFTNFGDSSLDFQLLFWSKDGFAIENIKSDLRFMILSKLNTNKVSIPFPQRDLHIKKDL